VPLAVAFFAQTRVEQDLEKGQKNELPRIIVIFNNFRVKFTNVLNFFQYSVQQTNIFAKFFNPNAIVLRSFVLIVYSGINFDGVRYHLHHFFLVSQSLFQTGLILRKKLCTLLFNLPLLVFV
jgi:hypothetical protein